MTRLRLLTAAMVAGTLGIWVGWHAAEWVGRQKPPVRGAVTTRVPLTEGEMRALFVRRAWNEEMA
jgi:hypothetical protein